MAALALGRLVGMFEVRPAPFPCPHLVLAALADIVSLEGKPRR